MFLNFLRSAFSGFRLASSAPHGLTRGRSHKSPPLRLLWLEDRTAPAVFTVTITGDSRAGSLRQAILDVNAGSTDTNTIQFNIPGSGVHAIEPATELPLLTNPVLIDGSTQPGFVNTPLIELDSNNLPQGANGLTVAGGDSTV